MVAVLESLPWRSLALFASKPVAPCVASIHGARVQSPVTVRSVRPGRPKGGTSVGPGQELLLGGDPIILLLRESQRRASRGLKIHLLFSFDGASMVKRKLITQAYGLVGCCLWLPYM